MADYLLKYIAHNTNNEKSPFNNFCPVNSAYCTYLWNGHTTLLPELFDFKVATTDLHNIFRAIMGLYIGLVIIWMIGIFKPRYWEVATISNIVFMGGLVAGRLISFVIDGMPSAIIIIGFFLETLIAVLGYFNWKIYRVK